MVDKNAAGIRLEYLAKVVNSMLADRELEAVLGAPIGKHIVLIVEDGHFKFHTLAPNEELGKKYTKEQEAEAAMIVQRILLQNYPGQGDLPGVR